MKPKQHDIIQVNMTSITISLFRWPRNDCTIQRFLLEYRRKSHNSWILVLDNATRSQKEILIPHLEPSTLYEIKITAHNDAGTTIVHYEVTTLLNVKGKNVVSVCFYDECNLI